MLTESGSLDTGQPSNGPGDEERPLVLVVDDEDLLRAATRRLLEAHGIATIGCGDGATALDAMAAHSFDAIVSDIAMPKTNGIELLRAVRREDLDLPVLFVTGGATVETAMQAIELGAFHYLLKPFSAEELARSTWRAIHLYRLAKAKQKAFERVGGPTGIGLDPVRLQVVLDRALDRLWPAFQPIIDARSRRVFGYEALMRTGEASISHPGALLDAAERLGQMRRVLSAMAELATGAFAAAPPDCRLFLNLHPADILDPLLLDPASAIRGIASRVVLEITERAPLDHVTNVRARIAALRKAGYSIAIDDLGAGYAGLSSFVSLEPEFVKVDMSLVRNVQESDVKQRLIRSMTGLCHDMGMLVVAEGIESAAELDVVTDLGCDLLQGFYLGMPARTFDTPAYCLDALGAPAP